MATRILFRLVSNIRQICGRSLSVHLYSAKDDVIRAPPGRGINRGHGRDDLDWAAEER
jgi:hypothetical protein